MTKCQPRLLTSFLDGELTEDAWQELDDHLESCPTCSAQLDELTAASQQVRAMGRAQIPKDSLKVALAVIAGRTGLGDEAAMTEAREVARAGADLVTDKTVDARHWIASAPPAPSRRSSRSGGQPISSAPTMCGPPARSPSIRSPRWGRHHRRTSPTTERLRTWREPTRQAVGHQESSPKQEASPK